MPYFHVIGKLNHSENTRVLLADLSQDMLQRDFLKPYGRGGTFFSGNDFVDSKELSQVRIIETSRTESQEREEMNRADRENIDSFNRESSGVFFLSIGSGYAPEDIAHAGVDVSQKFLKGAPGFKPSATWRIAPMLGWAAGIVSAVIASGIAKWLGWI